MVTDLVQRSWKHRLGLTVVAGVIGVAMAAGIISLAEARAPTPGFQVPATSQPRVLTRTDRDLYTNIFAAQTAGDWDRADSLIAKLDDKLLLGHVYYDRIMAPKRRASYIELRDWMKAYADHPGAKTVYKLAMQRKPDGIPDPRKPKVLAGRTPLGWADAPKIYRSAAARSEARVQQVNTTRRNLISMVDRGEPSNALNMLSTPDVNSQLDAVETDQIRQRIAAGFYHWGKVDEALEQAERAAGRSGVAIPTSHWYAGLARWQRGEIKQAAPHFEALARSSIASSWMRSAGAYWAARAYLITLQPERVVEMLEVGAENPRTFYGLLSIRALGADFPFDWSLPDFDKTREKRVLQQPALRRVIALKSLGRDADAEQEFMFHYLRTNWNHDEDLVALANALDMPSVLYRIGVGSANYEKLAQQGRTSRFPKGLNPRAYDAALYPMPRIAPKEGFRVDRALVFALIRQESRFRPSAKSGDGARGLMQIMPATARHVAKRTGLSSSVVNKLNDPSYNLMVGQRYLEELLNGANYNGDLVRMVAAYNGGPGNLRKWSRRVSFGDDALLFLESLPSRETRMFIERVLTNYWMYRIRLGQDTPSMDSLVAGDWPRYQAQDTQRIQISRN